MTVPLDVFSREGTTSIRIACGVKPSFWNELLTSLPHIISERLRQLMGIVTIEPFAMLTKVVTCPVAVVMGLLRGSISSSAAYSRAVSQVY